MDHALNAGSVSMMQANLSSDFLKNNCCCNYVYIIVILVAIQT